MTDKANGLEVIFHEAKSIDEAFQVLNAHMIEYTHQAARGECGWICSDCCMSDPEGMPDECFHGHQGCTEIIQRDKREAKQEQQP